MQLKKLKDLSTRTAPGRTPDYTPAHLLYTLAYLDENRVGRKQLAYELRIGEGTVRTLLGRLQDEKLIETTRQGISLSGGGAGFLAEIKKVLRWADFPHSRLTVGDHNFVVLIRGTAEKIRLGVKQRDLALIHGARGATTLVYEGGSWSMPGVSELIEGEVVDYLERFEPQENDVVVIGSSSDAFTAALGGFAAALDLV